MSSRSASLLTWLLQYGLHTKSGAWRKQASPPTGFRPPSPPGNQLPQSVIQKFQKVMAPSVAMHQHQQQAATGQALAVPRPPQPTPTSPAAIPPANGRPVRGMRRKFKRMRNHQQQLAQQQGQTPAPLAIAPPPPAPYTPPPPPPAGVGIGAAWNHALSMPTPPPAPPTPPRPPAPAPFTPPYPTSPSTPRPAPQTVQQITEQLRKRLQQGHQGHSGSGYIPSGVPVALHPNIQAARDTHMKRLEEVLKQQQARLTGQAPPAPVTPKPPVPSAVPEVPPPGGGYLAPTPWYLPPYW